LAARSAAVSVGSFFELLYMRCFMDRIVFAAIAMLSLGVSLMSGCSQEVAHSESDKPRLFGGRTHEESTTYKNPNGTYSTEKSKVKTD
jgi:hypothetical protein